MLARLHRLVHVGGVRTGSAMLGMLGHDMQGYASLGLVRPGWARPGQLGTVKTMLCQARHLSLIGTVYARLGG